MLRSMKGLPMVARVLLNVLLTVAWSYGLYVAYKILVAQREVPNTMISLKVANERVSPGGTLQLETNLVRNRYCRHTISQFIVDGRDVRYDLPVVTTPSNVHLGLDSFKRSIEIPQEISLGSATLILGTSFMCHWSHFFWPLRRPVIELHFIVDPQQ
jgi:hypothetical protein